MKFLSKYLRTKLYVECTGAWIKDRIKGRIIIMRFTWMIQKRWPEIPKEASLSSQHGSSTTLFTRQKRARGRTVQGRGMAARRTEVTHHHLIPACFLHQIIKSWMNVCCWRGNIIHIQSLSPVGMGNPSLSEAERNGKAFFCSLCGCWHYV